MAKQTTNIGARVGLLGELARNGRLAWQLLKDPGVPLAYKLIIPGIAGLYLLSGVVCTLIALWVGRATSRE